MGKFQMGDVVVLRRNGREMQVMGDNTEKPGFVICTWKEGKDWKEDSFHELTLQSFKEKLDNDMDTPGPRFA